MYLGEFSSFLLGCGMWFCKSACIFILFIYLIACTSMIGQLPYSLKLLRLLLQSFLVVFGADQVKKNVFTPISPGLRVVTDFLNKENLLCKFHETNIGSSTLFEAKVAKGVWSDQISERRNQERKCRFEVNAVRGKND